MCSLHKLLCILVLCIVYYMIIHNAAFKGVVLGVVVMCACASIYYFLRAVTRLLTMDKKN